MAKRKSELALAIEGLTFELKRYNDQNAPVIISGREDAEYFVGGSPEEEEKRELHQTLEELEAADRERRSQIRPKRRG